MKIKEKPGQDVGLGVRSAARDLMSWDGVVSRCLSGHPLDPAAPLCLSRTKTQSNAMMSSKPLSWEQNLCAAQEQQKNLCVALTPNVLGSATAEPTSFRAGVWLFPFINLSFSPPARIYFPLQQSFRPVGSPVFFFFLMQCAVTWLILYSGGIRLCRLQSHRRINKLTKCIFMVFSNKGQIWNSYLWDFAWRVVFLQVLSWEETKSFLVSIVYQIIYEV